MRKQAPAPQRLAGDFEVDKTPHTRAVLARIRMPNELQILVLAIALALRNIERPSPVPVFAQAPGEVRSALSRRLDKGARRSPPPLTESETQPLFPIPHRPLHFELKHRLLLFNAKSECRQWARLAGLRRGSSSACRPFNATALKPALKVVIEDTGSLLWGPA